MACWSCCGINRLEVPTGVLHAREAEQILQRVAVLDRLNERIVRPVRLNDRLLGLLDAHQHLQAVLIGAAPDGRIDLNVHGRVVLVRHDLGPLAAQPNHTLRDRVLDDLLKQALEKVAETSFSKRASNQLDTLLGSRDEEAHAFFGRGL